MDAGRPGSGGSVVPSGRIKLSEEVVRIGEHNPTTTHGDPKIQLLREDGAIRVIEITCSCGEVIRVRCEYS